MPNDEKTTAIEDEQSILPSDILQPVTASVDEIHRLTQSLDADERLRLVARLWSALPADHRAALVTLRNEELSGDRVLFQRFQTEVPIEPIGPDVWQFLHARMFDPKHASDLYSALRRFDLATIFVVTAAYSLLFGGLTAMGSPPAVKVIIGGLITIVAIAQALFLKVANPRGVSIVSGAVGLTVMLGILTLVQPHLFPGSFFLLVIIFGFAGGAFSGYLAGVLVGGVFLVADVLRGKFEGRSRQNESEPSATAGGESEHTHE